MKNWIFVGQNNPNSKKKLEKYCRLQGVDFKQCCYRTILPDQDWKHGEVGETLGQICVNDLIIIYRPQDITLLPEHFLSYAIDVTASPSEDGRGAEIYVVKYKKRLGNDTGDLERICELSIWLNKIWKNRLLGWLGKTWRRSEV